MRKPEPFLIPLHLVKDAELYAPGRKGSEAVSWILEDYPRRVREIRSLRSELEDLSGDLQLDQLIADLRAVLARYSV